MTIARIPCCLLLLFAAAECAGAFQGVPDDRKAEKKEPAPAVEIGGEAKLLVIDQDGNPVEGCTLVGYALRSNQDRGSHYGWTHKSHGPRPIVVTDKKGRALVPYPKWVSKEGGLTTVVVTVMADHPEFCINTGDDCAVGGITTLKLRPGGRLRLHAFRGNGKEPLTEFRSLVSGSNTGLRPWLPVKNGPKGRISPALEPGTKLIRIVQPEPDGSLLFSDLIRFKSVAGHTEDRLLRLKPGQTVGGELDGSVPRPVRNAHVVALIVDEVERGNTKEDFGGWVPREQLKWQTWRRIEADGSFQFDHLPPAKKIRLLAWCDDFVSRQPLEGTIPPSMKRNVGRRSMPQFFEIPEDGSPLVVAMEKAAACRFSVTTEDGQPVEGVEIGFFPNVIYAGGSTIFGTSGRAEVGIRRPEQSMAQVLQGYASAFTDRDDGHFLRPRFGGRTSKNGEVEIRNLPPRGNSSTYVQHPKLVPKGVTQPPFRSNVRVLLQSGETANASVTLVPRPKLDVDAAEKD